MAKLTGKAKAKARALKSKQQAPKVIVGNFKTEPWMSAVQDYISTAPYLKGIPYSSGNSIQFGKYVVAFDSDATSYADLDKAYLTEYSSMVFHGRIRDLCSKDNFVIDMNRDIQKIDMRLLEWVDENGLTATQRATMLEESV